LKVTVPVPQDPPGDNGLKVNLASTEDKLAQIDASLHRQE
jgi:hypothetical protein